MKYIWEPSLEHTALVKTVITLWNQNDIRALMEAFSLLIRRGVKAIKWLKIEDKVTEKVPHLPLPVHLKEKLLCFIKPIGLQIVKWMEYHVACFTLQVDLPSEFCWSPQGTIDWKKTAKLLIKGKHIDISNSYKLALVYCLEDDIQELHRKIPENFKDSISCIGSFHESTIKFLWTHILREKWGILNADHSYQHTFKYSAIWGNRVAVEYFFRKLTTSEREASLVNTASHVWEDNVFYFLFSQMDEEQQAEAFKSMPYQVLACFLTWPLQSFFFEIANHLWEFLTVKDYYMVLTTIIDKIKDGYKDCNYHNIFENVWKKCPKTFKSHNIREYKLLSYLLKSKNQENMKLVLQDATAIEKNIFIYSDKVLDICQTLINESDWELLKYVIRESLPSRYKMLKFKKELEKHLFDHTRDHIAKNKYMWDGLFCLSHNSVCKCNKRIVQEGERRRSKRLHKVQ